MNETVLSLKGITKSYDENKVLRGIDFSVMEGTIMGLVGKNGAGKSTMIKCLLGLIKPDEGEAVVFGEPAWNLSVRAKHRIGYVPQTSSTFSWMRVGSMLDYTGSFYDHWNTEKIEKLLKEWDLDAYAKIGSLSEGERQKLAIIQAMGHEPDVFILDEPVASLDPVARRKFIKQLIELNIDEEKTVLFSTHITSDLERVAADISLLKDGVITFTGDLSTLKDRVLRLRIQAKKPLHEPLPIPNILNSSVEGSNAVVTVDGLDEKEIRKIEKELSAVIAAEHLNLEDIFLELNK
jgi:ABC-2 type transport system ATP-binding protein